MYKERELPKLIGHALEMLLVTWLGAQIKLNDDQVFAALAAMDMREVQVVMSRCAGLTVEEVAAREGYGVTQVRLLTISGLRQAVEHLWPDGKWDSRSAAPQRLHRQLSPYAV
jgi:hypothetical protein